MQVPKTALLAGSATLALAASCAIAGAADTPSPTPVVVIVRVTKPWYAPRPLVVSRMRDTVAEYAQLPGLMFKAFSLERQSGDFGGIYFWRDQVAADGWFDPAWFERVRRERGVEPSVRRFDAPVSIDNTAGGTHADSDAKAVCTLVEIPIPAGVTRERLDADFAAAVATYRKVPGLLRKHFIVSSTGTFGGVYLWRDDASARAWFDDAWHARVIRTYGQDAKIEWFDTPILLPTRNAANTLAAGALVSTP
jgi:hypothetical protein